MLQGHLKNDEGVIEFSIAKDDFPLQKICHLSGKSAVSYYQVIERLNKPLATKVLFKPLTGRTHQLHIHSREIGHPILGCDLYASDEAFNLSPRLMLHASQLEFGHPISGGENQRHLPFPVLASKGDAFI